MSELEEVGRPALGAPHSRRFATAWRSLVTEVFGWRQEEAWVRVPALLGQPTLSYLPLLNYTDLSPAEARELAAATGSRPYQIRLLDPGREAKAGEPVVLRLDLGDLSADQLWRTRLGSKCRNQIRKADRSPIATRSGHDPSLIGDFYALLGRTLHRYGAPILPRALFDALPQALDVRYYVTYHDGRPIAALVAVADRHLVWVPWAASERPYLRFCPNHQAYWQAIRDGLESGKRLFDFGRSPHGGNTYRFKVQWGATAVAVAHLTSEPENVYRKYHLAQRLWRMAPRPVVDAVGPFLTRYLADY